VLPSCLKGLLKPLPRKFHIYYHSKLPAGRTGFVRVRLGGLGPCWCRAVLPEGQRFDPDGDYPLEIFGWYGFVQKVSEFAETRTLRHDPVVLTTAGLSPEDRIVLAGLYLEHHSGI